MNRRIFRILMAGMIIAALLAAPAMAAKKAPVPDEPVFGNNLSLPVIFAEGYGLTGLPTAELTGLRGTSVPKLTKPFAYNGTTYYLQRTENEWQAQWVNGITAGEAVRVDWSDNIVRQTWREDSVVRVEQVLFKDLVNPLKAFEMAYLYGEGINEVWGTTGKTYLSDLATVYSINARLTIQKLDGPGGAVKGKPVDSAIYQRFGVDGKTDAYKAECNVPGKIIYGYNWDLNKVDMASIGLPNEPKSGWYRISFSLDPLATYSVTDASGNVRPFSVACNTAFASLDPADQLGNATPDPVKYEPKMPNNKLTYLDLYIAPKEGGKRK